MRIVFYAENNIKLKELMIRTGVRKIYRFNNNELIFPREIVMVGNDDEKILWT